MLAAYCAAFQNDIASSGGDDSSVCISPEIENGQLLILPRVPGKVAISDQAKWFRA